MARLLKIPEPAGLQINEKVDARFDSKMNIPVPVTVRNILVENLNHTAFRKNSSRNAGRNKHLNRVVKT